MHIVFALSVIAIVISLMGVFSMVMFEAMYRRKEIGIRRVLGASVYEILRMFGQRYFYLVTVCFVVALPLSYYVVAGWLQNFAFKTPIHLWVFPLAFLLVLGITLVTVWMQTWQAATENPVESIKTEN